MVAAENTTTNKRKLPMLSVTHESLWNYSKTVSSGAKKKKSMFVVKETVLVTIKSIQGQFKYIYLFVSINMYLHVLYCI